jgi:hypothetical protein
MSHAVLLVLPPGTYGFERPGMNGWDSLPGTYRHEWSGMSHGVFLLGRVPLVQHVILIWSGRSRANEGIRTMRLPPEGSLSNTVAFAAMAWICGITQVRGL